MALDPIRAVLPSPEFQVAGLAELAPPPRQAGFGEMLAKQLGALDELQHAASAQAQALATGRAEDVAQVVMEVERATLALQLASQFRNRAVEAYQEVFRMQV